MDRQLRVVVDCGSYTCDYCRYLFHYEKGGHGCDLFELELDDHGDGPERDTMCLNAETR